MFRGKIFKPCLTPAPQMSTALQVHGFVAHNLPDCRSTVDLGSNRQQEPAARSPLLQNTMFIKHGSVLLRPAFQRASVRFPGRGRRRLCRAPLHQANQDPSMPALFPPPSVKDREIDPSYLLWAFSPDGLSCYRPPPPPPPSHTMAARPKLYSAATAWS